MTGFGAALKGKARPCHRCGEPSDRLFGNEGARMHEHCAKTPLNEAPHKTHSEPNSDLEREEVFQ